MEKGRGLRERERERQRERVKKKKKKKKKVINLDKSMVFYFLGAKIAFLLK